MEFWQKLSPAVRMSVIAGAIILGVLLVVRFYVSAPSGGYTDQRGIAGGAR